MTQSTYKTEKRKAAVGERILITDAKTAFNQYENGDVLTVKEWFHDYGVITEEQANKSADPVLISQKEYEVIVGEQPDHKAQATAAVEALIAQAYAEGYEAGVASIPWKDIRRDEIPRKPTVTEQQAERDRVVAKAKADIESLKTDFHGRMMYQVTYLMCDAEYIVNREKRTVVALLKHKISGVVARGIAKCDPSDCFNTALGKAISLRRALGLEVPAEYLNVPAPTEVRVGDIVKSPSRLDISYTVVLDGEQRSGNTQCALSSIAAKAGQIIDDSREGVSE